jgi:tetratricopeptide (TPR) repeat protein
MEKTVKASFCFKSFNTIFEADTPKSTTMIGNKFFAAIPFLFVLTLAVQAQTLEEIEKKAFDTYNAKDYTTSKILFQKLLNQGKKEGYIYWNIALCSSFLEEYDFSNENYQLAIPFYQGDNENLGTLYANIADNYSSLKKQELALTWYDKAISLDTKYKGKYLWNKGSVYFVMDKLTEANDYYKQAIPYYSDKIESQARLYKYIGDNYKTLADYQNAIESYNKGIALNPEEVGDIYWDRGIAYYWLQNYSGAIGSYQSALSYYTADESKATLYSNIAGCYNKMDDKTDAIQYYEKAIALNTEKSGSYLWSMAGILSDQKKYDEAINNFLKATSYYNDDPENTATLYSNIANNYTNLKEYDKAIENYTSSISKSPDNSKYLYYRGKANYIYLNNQAAAKPDFLKTIEMEKGRETIYTAYAKGFLGDKEGAIYLMNKLETQMKEPWEKSTHFYNYACLYALLSDESNAIAYLDKAITEGYSNYDWILKDDDFNFIKYKKSFKNLMEKHNIPFTIEMPSVEELITNEVRSVLNVWLVKGEFETSAQYQERIKNTDQKIKEIQNKVTQKLMKEELDAINFKDFFLGRYDADRQAFQLNYPNMEPIAVEVPIAEAPSFKENVAKLEFSGQKMVVSQNKWVLSYLKIKNPVTLKIYAFDITKQPDYDPSNLFALNVGDLNLDVDKNLATKPASKQEVTKANIYSIPDIDKEIPINPTKDENSFALVIGNENYVNEIKVPFAHNDAGSFKNYAEKVLGIPANHIHFAKDATYGQMLTELEWLANVIKAYNGKAKVFVYYAGHGMPDENSGTAYILPVDGNSTISKTAVKLDEMYSMLSQLPAEKITVFLDACFSGAARSGDLAKGRGVKIKPKENVVNGNLVIFSATSGNETAFPYAEMQHGLFTYYLLKKIKDTNGLVNYQELAAHLSTTVYQQAVVINNKPQTPTVVASPVLGESWKDFQLSGK